jgi:maltose O-acetyltransferase
MKSAKEKMLAGQPYLANGSELVGERLLAKELLFEFNNLRPVEVEARNAILQKLFGKTGGNFYVEPPFQMRLRIQYSNWR